MKEKERQASIKEHGREISKKKKFMKNNISWSNKVEKRLKRKIKREKAQIVEKKRKNEDVDLDDYNEVQKDFSLLKKLKKKKVSFNK